VLLGYNDLMSLFLLGSVFDNEFVFPFSFKFVREEVCVIMGFRYGPYVNIYSLPKVRNVHSVPENNFAVLQEDIDYLEQSDREGRVLGFIHTHNPESNDRETPSQEDLRGLPYNMIGGIWCAGKLHLFNRNGKVSYKLI
jgi:hypothetical protein